MAWQIRRLGFIIDGSHTNLTIGTVLRVRSEASAGLADTDAWEVSVLAWSVEAELSRWTVDMVDCEPFAKNWRGIG
jgi:hypothetical protein